MAETTIEFFDEKDPEYGWLSNFYPYGTKNDFRMVVDGKKLKTLEHGYQAAKHTDEKYIEEILGASTPMLAACLGRQKMRQQRFPWQKKYKALIDQYPDVQMRMDWDEIKLEEMYRLLVEKYTQNEDLGKKLLETGNRTLVECSKYDSYWGSAHHGKNYLGQLLMLLRKRLALGKKESLTTEQIFKKLKKL